MNSRRVAPVVLASVTAVPWPRPVPLVGDATSAAERAGDPAGWAMGDADVEALHQIGRAHV